MTLTRWKMMAGVLGLSIGGFAAMADPSKPKSVPPIGDKPAPVSIPVPTPDDVPQLAPPVGPAPLTIPTAAADVSPPVIATPADVPLLPEPAVMPTPVTIPEPTAKPKPVAVRELDFVVPAAPPVVVTTAAEEPTPMVPELSAEPPMLPPPSKPEPTPAPPKPEPTVAPSEPLLPPAPPAVDPVPPRTRAPEPAPVPPPPPTDPTVEKKLKVMLHMGDQRPRFEVKDAEEVYLKVVCDTVDVEAPTGKADGQSTLKAMGHCSFVTPGGDGVCDELMVVPGTGEVMVSGNVRFVYRWGRAETEVSGAKMTFRLGATPDGMISSANHRDDVSPRPLPTAMPASYTVPR